METLAEIINHFNSNALLYTNINSFSKHPGIYAVHFMGNAFPVYKMMPEKNEIIYIGKTEKSQASRDANTHFATGKTGSSTLRRSIGALMLKGAKLNPIPRSKTEKSEKRFTNYMFDEAGEKLISEWMTKNLGLSFYEFTGSKSELDELETKLIKELKPMLNIDSKNTGNPHFDFIRNLRAECVIKAKSNESLTPPIIRRVKYKVKHPSINSISKGLYVEIWEKVMPYIKAHLEYRQGFTEQFNDQVFSVVGNRQRYSFRLELKNGTVQNNIGDSAIARDLYAVLLDSKEVHKLLSNKTVVFQLSSKLVFSMSIVSDYNNKE